MKYEDENDNLLIKCLFLGAILGLLIGFFVGDGVKSSQAIQRGYAEYNPTNGVWQWKEQAK